MTAHSGFRHDDSGHYRNGDHRGVLDAIAEVSDESRASTPQKPPPHPRVTADRVLPQLRLEEEGEEEDYGSPPQTPTLELKVPLQPANLLRSVRVRCHGMQWEPHPLQWLQMSRTYTYKSRSLRFVYRKSTSTKLK